MVSRPVLAADSNSGAGPDKPAHNAPHVSIKTRLAARVDYAGGRCTFGIMAQGRPQHVFGLK